MTVKELYQVYCQVEHCKRGYCCYQDAGVSKYDLIKIGYNSGVYGWNWSAYIDPKTNTLYIDCYRNVPGYMEEK